MRVESAVARRAGMTIDLSQTVFATGVVGPSGIPEVLTAICVGRGI